MPVRLTPVRDEHAWHLPKHRRLNHVRTRACLTANSDTSCRPSSCSSPPVRSTRPRVWPTALSEVRRARHGRATPLRPGRDGVRLATTHSLAGRPFPELPVPRRRGPSGRGAGQAAGDRRDHPGRGPMPDRSGSDATSCCASFRPRPTRRRPPWPRPICAAATAISGYYARRMRRRGAWPAARRPSPRGYQLKRGR